MWFIPLYVLWLCTYFQLLSMWCLPSSYNVETLNTVCYNVNYDCIKYHATEVNDLINKTKDFYVSHDTLLHKNGVTSMITYKSRQEKLKRTLE